MPKKQFIAMVFDVKVTPDKQVVFLEGGRALHSNLKHYSQHRNINVLKTFRDFIVAEGDKFVLVKNSAEKTLPDQKNVTTAEFFEKPFPHDAHIFFDDSSNDVTLRAQEFFRLREKEFNNQVVDGYGAHYLSDKALFREICIKEDIPHPVTDVIPFVDLGSHVLTPGRFEQGAYIKPALGTQGEGSLVVADQKALQAVIKTLSANEETRIVIKPQAERDFYTHWQQVPSQLCLILLQQLIHGQPIVRKGKPYDPTVRIIALASVEAKATTLHFYDAYCSYPDEPIGREPTTENIYSNRLTKDLDLQGFYKEVIFSETCQNYVKTLAAACVTTPPRALWQQTSSTAIRPYFLQRAERLETRPLPLDDKKDLGMLQQYTINSDINQLMAVVLVLRCHFFGLMLAEIPQIFYTPITVALYGFATQLAQSSNTHVQIALFEDAIKAIKILQKKEPDLNSSYAYKIIYLLRLTFSKMSDTSNKQKAEDLLHTLIPLDFKPSELLSETCMSRTIGPFNFFGHFTQDSQASLFEAKWENKPISADLAAYAVLKKGS